MKTRKQPTEAQKAQAAANRERFKQLCQRVAAMSEDQRAALTARYGLTTVEGHSLSPYNCCLIISQCPDFRWCAHKCATQEVGSGC